MDRLDAMALEYVMQNGTPWERWRARRLLGSAGPLPPDWADRQNPDGGWRSREFSSPVSNMGTTSVTLMRTIWCGLGDSPECRATVEYLRRTQQPDGRWTEDPAQYGANPPEWNRPGDLAVDLWETANNAACLCALGLAQDPVTEKAVAWLRANRREDGTFPGYIHTTYAMAAVCHMRGEGVEAERYLADSLRILHKFKDESWFDVMDLTWALILWGLAGLDVRTEAVRSYRDELRRRRNADGTWSSRYPGCGPQYTLEAVEILRVLG
ncbi:prenyltransferase/squalene oxidase repeat-containing protein [Symbiobacterium thermophilum]|uniref:Squalene cyclase C-terminal domain-containing protein n=1 Tax=Symbiobacterium thermophilum TaxID=2734 RepID=A0A953LHF7_SYMTR|nr:prenyltransferase/squalene oxidase repeat-containing protein [Symbiobacterium thermophilum]MBY6276216.1 hypothetical protein [Symbiobacterium thermophilum]